MRRTGWLGVVLLAAGLLPLAGQQVREERTVLNVGVPVRVFRGNAFVSDLGLGDFEVLEDGVPQKLEAVYLVHGTAVERREETSRFTPETDRHFYLFFEITDFTPQIGDALDDFIEKVLAPGDTLSVVTPVRTYRMRVKALEVQDRPAVAAQLRSILREDTFNGSAEYRRLLEDLEDIARALSRAIQDLQSEELFPNPGLSVMQASAFRTADFRPEQLLLQYAAALSNMEAIRKLDVTKMLSFASQLKGEDGQKYVFMFYQREFLPEVEPRLLQTFIALSQDRPDSQHAAASIFELYKRYNNFDLESVKRAYADASIAIHFLFISEPFRNVIGLKFRERSEDVYSAFREMALATGGSFETSANPRFLLQDAVEAAENYYLLYYSPSNPVKDGRFRKITVRVRNGDYRITNRQGYIAD
jgi:hypothetical protein